MSNIGKLILVGAGPGDPDLFTLKGIKALNRADVVLYDALANDELLSYAPETAERIFVGKLKGICRTPQEEIHELIVKFALQGKTVVRLKGGDPFIFGRGHEELEYAQTFGIESEIVPGLSSSISLATLQGVPLTRRGINESFFVVTATTRHHELSNDIRLASQTSATVVVLMGMHKLNEIIDIYKAEGKGETAVAIVQNGSTTKEQVALGTINTIVQIVEARQLSSPSVILIGDVVKLHPNYVSEIAKQYAV